MKPDNSTLDPVIRDTEWRDTLPPALRPVALRHGRPLFELCLNCLGASERLSIMAGQIKSQDAQQNLHQIAQMLNNVSMIALTALGVDDIGAKECSHDIKMACALQQPQPEPEVGSRIFVAPGITRH